MYYPSAYVGPVTLGLLGVMSVGTIPSALAQAQPVTPPPPPKWEKTAALGLSLTRGNSDTILFTGNVLGTKKSPVDEWNVGADASYGKNNDEKNNETLHGFVQYNRLFSEKWYAYGRLDGLHDAIADLEYRFTLSPGVGYYFIKNESTRLSAEGGPAFIYEKQGTETRGYMAFRAGERFEHKFNDKTKIWQSLEFLPQVDRLSNYILNGEIGVDTALTQKLSLRTFLQDTYDNEPAPGREKNDLKLVSALAYKF
jgi:putative salt-induced outer membrane protein YdiY